MATLGTALRSRPARWVARPSPSGDLAAQLAHARSGSGRRSVSIFGLTRATGTDAATAGDTATGLPGQRLTPAAQARQHVLHLGQLDLGLALPAAGVLGEDVEDQRGPVDDLDLEHFSSWLSWPGVSSPSQITVSAPVAATMSRISLALPEPDVGGGVRLVAPLADRLEHLRAGGLGQRRRARRATVGVDLGALGPHPDEHDALEAQLPVLDLGDVGELGGEARHAA
jgi:hypothetical protein